MWRNDRERFIINFNIDADMVHVQFHCVWCTEVTTESRKKVSVLDHYKFRWFEYYFSIFDCNLIIFYHVIVFRWWRRPLNNHFQHLGDFSQLFQKLKTTDHEEFFKYTKMIPDQFDWLLEKTYSQTYHRIY